MEPCTTPVILMGEVVRATVYHALHLNVPEFLVQNELDWAIASAFGDFYREKQKEREGH